MRRTMVSQLALENGSLEVAYVQVNLSAVYRVKGVAGPSLDLRLDVVTHSTSDMNFMTVRRSAATSASGDPAEAFSSASSNRFESSQTKVTSFLTQSAVQLRFSGAAGRSPGVGRIGRA